MFDFDDLPPPATPLGTAVADEQEEEWVLDDKGAADCDEGARLGVAIARPQPLPSAKPPLCALIVPGMPMKVFGGSRMSDPLLTAVAKRCWVLGLPTVRFDYTGCGRSVGKEPSFEDGHVVMKRDASRVLRRVLDAHCERVVVIAYSAGNSMVLHELAAANAQGKVAAYVSLSMGTRANALTSEEAASTLTSKEADLSLLPADDLELFDSLDVPSLFLLGGQDLITPAVDIAAITQRKSRKTKAELQVLPGKHAFPGVEDRPADAIKAFLMRALPGGG